MKSLEYHAMSTIEGASSKRKANDLAKKMRKRGMASPRKQNFHKVSLRDLDGKGIMEFANACGSVIFGITSLGKREFVKRFASLQKEQKQVVLTAILKTRSNIVNITQARQITQEIFVSHKENKAMKKKAGASREPRSKVISKDQLPPEFRNRADLAHEITTIKRIKREGIQAVSEECLPEDEKLIEQFKQFEGPQLNEKLEEALDKKRSELYNYQA